MFDVGPMRSVTDIFIGQLCFQHDHDMEVNKKCKLQVFRWNDDLSDTGGQKLKSLFVNSKLLSGVFMDVSKPSFTIYLRALGPKNSVKLAKMIF